MLRPPDKAGLIWDPEREQSQAGVRAVRWACWGPSHGRAGARPAGSSLPGLRKQPSAPPRFAGAAAAGAPLTLLLSAELLVPKRGWG